MSMFLWDQPTTTDRDLKIATGANFHWQKTLFQWRSIEGKAKGVFDWTEPTASSRPAPPTASRSSRASTSSPTGRAKTAPTTGRPTTTRTTPTSSRPSPRAIARARPSARVDAIEVWNEVNLDREWGTQPINQQQAADYVRLLTLAYRAAHAADPNIIVITAGLSPTGVTNSHGLGRRRSTCSGCSTPASKAA